MLRLAFALCLLPTLLFAGPHRDVIKDVVEGHVLPGFERLAAATGELSRVASEACAAGDERALRETWGAAFDSWISVSHLRLGPSEEDDRAFALAFWPDSKGYTPKALRALITAQDPAGRSAADFAQVSIAARGFYAMEFLLYDEDFAPGEAAGYRCELIATMAQDMSANAEAILGGWLGDYAAALLDPGEMGAYRTEEEAVQALYKALTTGLQFTSDTRLGRPLGSFERPSPKRAETWRSGRSLANVVLSLVALQDLARRLSAGAPVLASTIDADFAAALQQVELVDDPVLALVSDPSGRLKVEILQQAIDRIRTRVATELGPHLGVAAGFNALDGD